MRQRLFAFCLKFPGNTSAAQTFLLSLVVIILIVRMGFLVYNRTRGPRVVLIEPFSVALDLSNRGYTSQAVAQKFADQVQQIREVAQTRLDSPDFNQAVSDSLPDIDVAGSKLPFDAALRFFGYSPPRISGEVVKDGDRIRVTLHVTDQDGQHTIDVPPAPLGKSGSLTLKNGTSILDDRLLIAVLRAVDYFHPYVTAAYYHSTGRPFHAVSSLISLLQRDDRESELRHRSVTAWLLSALRQDERLRQLHRAWVFDLWGVIKMEAGDYSRAREMMVAARRYDFALPDYNLGVLEEKLAEPYKPASSDYNRYETEATRHYREALAIDPKFEHARLNLAFALSKLRDYTQADVEFDRAVALDQTDPLIYRDRGDRFYEEARTLSEAKSRKQAVQSAIENYQKAIQWDPAAPEPYNTLGEIAGTQGQLPAARAAFRQAIELRPGWALPHLNLARAIWSEDATASDIRAAVREYGTTLKLGLHGPERTEAISAIKELKDESLHMVHVTRGQRHRQTP